MSKLITQRTTIWLLGIVVSGIANGQSADSESLNVDMTQCLNLATENQRLACYQERVEAALADREAAARTAPAPARAGEPARPANADTPAAAPARQAPVAASAAAENRGVFDADEYHATITELRRYMPNRFVITLDNGQVWQMNQSKRYPLRVGQEVRVVSTRWGDSWRLTAVEHGGFVQVRRAL